MNQHPTVEKNQMEENVQQTADQAAPGLGVQDLVLMFQIIQVVSQRGGFRADEMSNVGGLYDRLRTFLTAAGLIKAPVAPGTEEQATGGNES
jgi:hypothetical protein